MSTAAFVDIELRGEDMQCLAHLEDRYTMSMIHPAFHTVSWSARVSVP